MRRQPRGKVAPRMPGLGLYPTLVGCSFEPDCAFNSARARCMTRAGDAGAIAKLFTPRLDDSIAKVHPADCDIAPACCGAFPYSDGKAARCSYLGDFKATVRVCGARRLNSPILLSFRFFWPYEQRALDIFTFWSKLLQCFRLFVADAPCNRRKGIVVRLALCAIADDSVQFENAGQLASR